jgi:nicotinamidase-related amidase
MASEGVLARTALMVVDMHNDFVSPEGALYNPAAERVIPNIVSLVADARRHGVQVIFTQDWHRKRDVEFAMWPPHGVERTWGAEFLPALEPQEDDLVIRKRTYNAFFGTDLDQVVRQHKIRRMVFSGTVSNICVLNTAGDAALRGIEVILPQDAIISLTEFDHQATLRQASSVYRAAVTAAERAFGEEMPSVGLRADAAPPPVEVEDQLALPAHRAALIVVDMQNDFATEGGALYVPGTLQTLEPIAQLVRAARQGGAAVIFTQDWHRADDREFGIWPRHCVEGTFGADVVKEFEPTEADHFVKKRTYDAFFGTDLDLLLQERGIEHMVLVGTVANICVLHTAGTARLSGYNVVVAEDGISALTLFDHQFALRQISWLYAGKIVRGSGIRFE